MNCGKRNYANVTATIALVVALGGTSYAAASLPRNSVGTKQLKANAVTSSKVKNGSLHASDFKRGQLPEVGKTTPIAIFNVSPEGSINAQSHRSPVTGPISVDKGNAGKYEVTIPGVDFYYTKDVAVCNEVNGSGFVLIGSDQPRLIVNTTDASGDPSDEQFSCAAYNIN